VQDAGQVPVAAAALEVREQRRVPVAEALARVLARQLLLLVVLAARADRAGPRYGRVPARPSCPPCRGPGRGLPPLRGDIVSKNSW
jgi:hypothetical protein